MVEVTSNPKHKAIIAVLYSSGIRRDELINLRLSDIDSERMVIRVVNGKGNKSRDTLLANKTLQLLQQYYSCTFPKPIRYVFEAGGKPGQTYSPTSVSRIIKRAVQRAKIKKKYLSSQPQTCFCYSYAGRWSQPETYTKAPGSQLLAFYDGLSTPGSY